MAIVEGSNNNNNVGNLDHVVSVIKNFIDSVTGTGAPGMSGSQEEDPSAANAPEQAQNFPSTDSSAANASEQGPSAVFHVQKVVTTHVMPDENNIKKLLSK